MINIDKLENEVFQQIRNGRTEVYIKTDDLKELGIVPTTENEREFVDINVLKVYLKKYKFKGGLKTDAYFISNEEMEAHLSFKDSKRYVPPEEREK